MGGASTVSPAGGTTWAMFLGIVAVLFGVLLAAAQGNELLAQKVIAPGTAASRDIPADCRADEAEQEGVSPAECELMVAQVRIVLASRPAWFRPFQIWLALAGLLGALGSVVVGLGLVDDRRWALSAAAVTFGLLLALDVAGFTAALYTGPLLRALYLSNLFLWFAVHLCLTAGAVVGRRAERAARVAAEAVAA